jgi:hypothetical protein
MSINQLNPIVQKSTISYEIKFKTLDLIYIIRAFAFKQKKCKISDRFYFHKKQPEEHFCFHNEKPPKLTIIHNITVTWQIKQTM